MSNKRNEILSFFDLKTQMLEGESALDLFQRLQLRGDASLIERLNRSFHFFFPEKRADRAQLIELFAKNRRETKVFLHQMIFDYLKFVDERDELLRRPFQRGETLSSSPRANKDSVGSDVPVLHATFDEPRPLTFLYIDTESRECPFDHRRVRWFDCSTSTELLSTLCRLEKTFSTEHCLLIIDSTSQLPINDYFLRSTNDDDEVLSLDESKRLTSDWHRLLCRLLIEHRFSSIFIEYVDLFSPIFDLIRSTKRPSNVGASDYSFARLMSTEENERCWKNQLDYRPIFDLPSE